MAAPPTTDHGVSAGAAAAVAAAEAVAAAGAASAGAGAAGATAGSVAAGVAAAGSAAGPLLAAAAAAASLVVFAFLSLTAIAATRRATRESQRTRGARCTGQGRRQLGIACDKRTQNHSRQC
jgi:membrane protein implicated in regulation of membrane protease activity